jgi:hypothetical protein
VASSESVVGVVPSGIVVDDVPSGIVVDDVPSGIVVDDVPSGRVVDEVPSGIVVDEVPSGIKVIMDPVEWSWLMTTPLGKFNTSDSLLLKLLLPPPYPLTVPQTQ